ncbi:MAG: fasciclin domain-containing protein [Acidobacteria bacterium]|nr:fasciclin domain-containing protein [Acidobacteriota bacterium]
MNIKTLATIGLMVVATAAVGAQMGKTKMVGGAEMFPSKNIIENAVNSRDHTTLVAAVKAAGLVETLNGTGPFTVFAPTNAAFAKLPAGTVDTLLKPENKSMLTGVLTYHVVAGKWDSMAVAKLIKDGMGKAEIKTVAGGALWASMSGKDLILTDEKGGKAKVTIADVHQSNGVIHVIDTVLMPR